MDRTSSFAKSFATSVSGLKPLNKQILCDKMCPMTTMACGREVGNGKLEASQLHTLTVLTHFSDVVNDRMRPSES